MSGRPRRWKGEPREQRQVPGVAHHGGQVEPERSVAPPVRPRKTDDARARATFACGTEAPIQMWGLSAIGGPMAECPEHGRERVTALNGEQVAWPSVVPAHPRGAADGALRRALRGEDAMTPDDTPAVAPSVHLVHRLLVNEPGVTAVVLLLLSDGSVRWESMPPPTGRVQGVAGP